MQAQLDYLFSPLRGGWRVEYTVLFCTGGDLGSSLALTLRVLGEQAHHSPGLFSCVHVEWETNIGLFFSFKDPIC